MNALGTDGERVKLEQLYDLYRDFLFRLALRVLHNEHDAEDAVQNAFLAVARHISKVPALDSPKTRGFLAVVTEQKAIDIYREHQRHGTVELSGEEAASVFPEGEGLAGCLAKLPAREREMILLKHIYGYTTREAAEILDLSHAAASKLDQRARKRLHALCREEGLL